MVNAGLYSSATPQWYTPPDLARDIADFLGGIDLDPCAEPAQAIPASTHYVAPRQDGLALPWRLTEWEPTKVFVNPPYGRAISQWTEYALSHHRSQCEIILLLPARTDTAWFAPILRECSVCFLTGRLKFSGAVNSAPFPSALVYYGWRNEEFSVRFRKQGVVMWRAFSPNFPDPGDEA